jgi:hypothetical protein
MEKVEQAVNFKKIGGDSDSDVDWEDFIIISGNFQNSYD